MLDFRDIVASVLQSQVKDITKEEMYEMLEYPPNPEMGDLAFPCFKLAKVFRKAPPMIAQDIVNGIGSSEYLERIEPQGGYVNFFFSKKAFAESVVSEVFEKKNSFGSDEAGKGKTIVLDYSAPNIAKPFHIGHLRTTVIGNSIAKIFSFLGYECVRVNHLGDWGTQFGKLIVAYKKWGNKEEVENGKVKALMDLYVRFHEEAEKAPELEEEARNWFLLMEKKDEEALQLWNWFKDLSLAEFQRVYDILKIDFDSWAGEAFYNDKIDPVINRLNEKNLLVESEGALIVDLTEYDMPPCLIMKKNGSTLYATRDLAAAIYRKNTYNFEKCIYVTALQQNLHFQQWFKVVDLMGYDWANQLVHVPYGMVSLESGKIATRKGNVVLLEELLNEAVKKTLEIIEEKNPNLENKEEVAKQIGIGAVIFNDLSNNRIKDIVFSWDKILNFDGETGPYVQYTHTRACSVLRRAEEQPSAAVNYELLTNPEALAVIKVLYDFPTRVKEAANKLEPSLISRALIDLAQEFNRFYHECPILSAPDAVTKQARLALVEAVRVTIANGLALLGIEAPEKM